MPFSCVYKVENAKEDIFMKKNLCNFTAPLMAVIVLLAMLSGVGFGLTAYAKPLDGDEYDGTFVAAVKQLAATDGEFDVVADKTVLYDLDINPMGYIYDFAVSGTSGYAVVVNCHGAPEVAELVPEGTFPFAHDDDAKFVYVACATFLRCIGSSYYLPGSDVALTEDEVQSFRSMGSYFGGSTFTVVNETISYKDRKDTLDKLVATIPSAIQPDGLSNSCAAVAGVNIVQYWDRFCENLIPNFTSYRKVGTRIMYKSNVAELETLRDRLYIDMQTDVVTPGTTVNQFKNGLTAYCARQGYSVTYSSCMSSGKLNYATAKQKIGAGQPLAVFCKKFNLDKITSNTGNDEIEHNLNVDAHIMVAFGYTEYVYTLQNGSTRTDSYLYVASGCEEAKMAYYNINYNTTVSDCFGVAVA